MRTSCLASCPLCVLLRARPHTHTLAHAHARTRTHACMHACTHARTSKQSYTHSNARMRFRVHVHTLTCTRTGPVARQSQGGGIFVLRGSGPCKQLSGVCSACNQAGAWIELGTSYVYKCIFVCSFLRAYVHTCTCACTYTDTRARTSMHAH
jgi:hypothetical protein